MNTQSDVSVRELLTFGSVLAWEMTTEQTPSEAEGLLKDYKPRPGGSTGGTPTSWVQLGRANSSAELKNSQPSPGEGTEVNYSWRAIVEHVLDAVGDRFRRAYTLPATGLIGPRARHTDNTGPPSLPGCRAAFGVARFSLE
ncbi:unnamed protein product [Heligmosomoides polygyrus]|uniref:Peptidase_M13_N domain-containing protein n=1 Tax=Heligmosomoides polygyrus TaxID=6339 RepID=A0A183FHG4_HELPZ|nr:unnamed protein product [Heligmosomoides polygyrus]